MGGVPLKFAAFCHMDERGWRHALNPEHPANRGSNAGPDVYFRCKEGAGEIDDAPYEKAAADIKARCARHKSG